MLKIALGEDVFVNYINNSDLYIDKSLFIKDIIDSQSKISLITRPRRFGKTLNMTMLQAYFKKTDKDYAPLFHNLKIWQQGENYTSKQGKYPVIFITLKDMFSHAIKTNASLGKAILTGLTKIAEKSLFSKLNHFISYNVLEKEFNYENFKL